jgi:hypothetical protein
LRRDDDLKAEYLKLQDFYEAYDQRALSLKGLATPLLGAGLAVGIKEGSHAFLWITIAVAASLWLLEALWKSFQYRFRARIVLLESWFRGEGADGLAPFQIYASWSTALKPFRRLLSAIAMTMLLPFVFLPYLIVVVAGAVLLRVH